MKIRYVVSTMVFWWRENSLSFEQNCDYLRSLGFGIELWPNVSSLNECRYDRKNWSRLSEATKGMLVSMRSRNDDPTLEQWDEQLQCAKLLGANIVTNLSSFGIAESAQINGCDYSSEIMKLAEDYGVNICLETGKLEHLLKLGDKFESLKFCLDVGFANLDREFGLKKYVNKLADRVTHLHLHDNYGHIDDHRPPGLKGGISRENWDHLFDVLSGHGNGIIACFEMHPCMPEVMIRQASEFVFDELGWPNKPKSKVEEDGFKYDPL